MFTNTFFIFLWLWVMGSGRRLRSSLGSAGAFTEFCVPNLGSILAAIPAILLTTIHLGFGYALIAALGYVDVNVIIGNIIEPRVMGKGLDLSTLVVFLSLVFWGWVLRQIGCG